MFSISLARRPVLHLQSDPIDHPAIRAMGPRKLADLPLPRYRLPDASAPAAPRVRTPGLTPLHQPAE